MGRSVGAFEIKATSNIAGPRLSGLRAFREENAKAVCAVISTVDHTYQVQGIKILPWQSYLKQLSEIL